MKKVIVFFLPFLFLIVACACLCMAADTPEDPSAVKTEKQQAADGNDSPKKETGQVVPPPSQASAAGAKTDRNAELKKLKEEYNSASTKAEESLNNLKKRADKRSGGMLWTSAAGIASGLTASVLLVASPANAVWAAAFTGFSTGILAFQDQLSEEGYSRLAVARIHETTQKTIIDANTKYLTNVLILQTRIEGSNALSKEDWNKYLALAWEAIAEMTSAARFTSMSMGTSADVQQIKKQNEEILEKLKKIDSQLSAGGAGGEKIAGWGNGRSGPEEDRKRGSFCVAGAAVSVWGKNVYRRRSVSRRISCDGFPVTDFCRGRGAEKVKTFFLPGGGFAERFCRGKVEIRLKMRFSGGGGLFAEIGRAFF